MNASRARSKLHDVQPIRALGTALVCALGLGALGCDSNPTPHPAQDSTGGGYEDTRDPNIAAPDQDGDGVDDCAEVGEFWDGSSCRGDAAIADGVSPISDTAGESVDGEVGDGVDAIDGEIVDRDAGPDGSDAGPDASPHDGDRADR